MCSTTHCASYNVQYNTLCLMSAPHNVQYNTLCLMSDPHNVQYNTLCLMQHNMMHLKPASQKCTLCFIHPSASSCYTSANTAF